MTARGDREAAAPAADLSVETAGGFRVGKVQPFAAETDGRRSSVRGEPAARSSRRCRSTAGLRAGSRRAPASRPAISSSSTRSGRSIAASKPGVSRARPCSSRDGSRRSRSATRRRAIGRCSCRRARSMLAAVTPSSVIAAREARACRPPAARLDRLALAGRLRRLPRGALDRRRARPARRRCARNRRRPARASASRSRDVTSSRCSGAPSTRWPSQLQTRLEELEAERRRLRDVIARFGEALASAHDSEQLRRLIVESAVEATGRRWHPRRPRTARTSRRATSTAAESGSRCELTAGRLNFGSLVLFGDDFDEEDRMTAVSLAGQAVVALEKPACTGSSSGRRSSTGSPGSPTAGRPRRPSPSELARVERSAARLRSIVADLDEFKAVNDRYGHPAGDTVLREFAETLRENVREIDTRRALGRGGVPARAARAPTSRAPRAWPSASGRRLRRADRSRWTALRSRSRQVSASPTPVATTRVAELVDAADAAIYRAKRAGKNRVDAGAEPVTRIVEKS